MPKMKTKSAAKKRFRVRPGGTVKRGQAFKRHILTKKTTKNKRHLRGVTAVHATDMGRMAQMLLSNWDKVDTNKDGFIEVSEMGPINQMMGGRIRQAQAQQSVGQ